LRGRLLERLDDATAVDRQAAILQDRVQPRRIATELDREQALELSVAVLLDHEDSLVVLDELRNLVRKRVGARAAVIEMDASSREPVERLTNRPVRAPHPDQPPLRRFRGAADDGLRHELRGGAPFLHEPVDDLLVFDRVFGVEPELVVARAAHEVRALRMHAGERPGGNPITVDVEIAGEALDALQLLGTEHFAAIGAIAVVPR
jgi:hypothetical protein